MLAIKVILIQNKHGLIVSVRGLLGNSILNHVNFTLPQKDNYEISSFFILTPVNSKK